MKALILSIVVLLMTFTTFAKIIRIPEGKMTTGDIIMIDANPTKGTIITGINIWINNKRKLKVASLSACHFFKHYHHNRLPNSSMFI